MEDNQIRTVWTVAAKPNSQRTSKQNQTGKDKKKKKKTDREQLRTGLRQAHSNIQCYTKIVIITISVAEPKKFFLLFVVVVVV